MTKDSKVSSISNPDICDDVVEDSHGEHFDIESLTQKGEMVLGALPHR